jgi:hypothetical protein
MQLGHHGLQGAFDPDGYGSPVTVKIPGEEVLRAAARTTS